MSNKEIDNLIERSKNDRETIVGSEIRDAIGTLRDQVKDLRVALLTMLDQIDGDVRATQWFDERLIERARAAIATTHQE